LVVHADDLDLLAQIHLLTRGIRGPKVLGADMVSVSLWCRLGELYGRGRPRTARLRLVEDAGQMLCSSLGTDREGVAAFLDSHVLDRVRKDLFRVSERLQAEGFLDRVERPSGDLIKSWRRPREMHPGLAAIREDAKRGEYERAIAEYYNMLGAQPHGELTPELLYLRRLANSELAGRDVLYFLPPAARGALVTEHLQEFVACLDRAIAAAHSSASLVKILQQNAPTMSALIAEKRTRFGRSVWLTDGVFTPETTATVVDEDFFSPMFSHVLAGRIFTKYPDQVALCSRFEQTEDPKYHQFWTTYPNEFLEQEVTSKGLRLQSIDAYRHAKWTWRGKRGTREPDFTTARSLSEVVKCSYGVDHVRYTGRRHRIEGVEFHEADLVRNVRGEYAGNPFLDAIQSVLRDGENMLREQHGLPRIGEGWVTEMLLFDLVRRTFPDALHHAMPEWLKPQHLDVYVPSERLAFEFQGLQHYQPVDFFGGEEAHLQLQKRDQVKARKCGRNGVMLIAWPYDKPLNAEALKETLREAHCGGNQDRAE
jgi:hypothetical protein